MPLVSLNLTKLSQNMCIISTHFLRYQHTRCDCKIWNFYFIVLFLGIFMSVFFKEREFTRNLHSIYQISTKENFHCYYAKEVHLNQLWSNGNDRLIVICIHALKYRENTQKLQKICFVVTIFVMQYLGIGKVKICFKLLEICMKYYVIFIHMEIRYSI